MLDKPKAASPKSPALSPKALARLKEQRALVLMLKKINDPKAVFEVRLGADDKAPTMRLKILRAAEEAKKDVVVRKSDKGWLVGMATAERRSKRGRRKKA